MEPKRDQWWRLKGGTIVFVAFDNREIRYSNSESSLRFLTYDKNKGNVFHHWRDLSEFDVHLPECTGFDWKPEVFPQYWSTGAPNYAFVKRLDKGRCVFVDKDGKESVVGAWYSRYSDGRTQLTEEQALAMLVKWPRYFVINDEGWIRRVIGVAEDEALARVAKGPVVQAAQWETVVIGGKTFEVREVAK